MSKNVSKRNVLFALILIASVAASSLLSVYAFQFMNGHAAGALDVSIYPRGAKLYVGQTQLFQAVAYNGTPPFSYSWFSNGTLICSGVAINFSFTQPCKFVTLSVEVTDKFDNRGFVAVIVYDPLSFSTTIEEGSMVSEASYIIFEDSGTYYARDGMTGAIDYSGTDAVTMIQSALGGLTSGRTWNEKIVLKGSFLFDDVSLDIPSKTIVDLTQATLSGFTVSPLKITGTKSDIEIFGGRLVSGGLILTEEYPSFVDSRTAYVTNLKLHDLYLEGNAWNPFPTFSVPALDNFGIMLGGVANVQIYNIKAKNVGNVVFIAGGGVDWVSSNISVKGLQCEEINGAVHIKSNCKLMTNVVVDDILVDKFWDQLVEVCATNGGNAPVAGEIKGVEVTNCIGRHGTGTGGGVALLSETTVGGADADVHDVHVRGVHVIYDRSYGETQGAGFSARVSAGMGDVYDFVAEDIYAENCFNGVYCSLLFVSGNLGGIIRNVQIKNCYGYGVYTGNCLGSIYRPLIWSDVQISMNATGLGGIRNMANLQSVTGVIYDRVSVYASGVIPVISDAPSGGNSIGYVLRDLEYAGSTTFDFDATLGVGSRGKKVESIGTSTGTGAQQTIAHGLLATPTYVLLWDIESGANPFLTDKDATNIYPQATLDKDYGWLARVV